MSEKCLVIIFYNQYYIVKKCSIFMLTTFALLQRNSELKTDKLS